VFVPDLTRGGGKDWACYGPAGLLDLEGARLEHLILKRGNIASRLGGRTFFDSEGEESHCCGIFRGF